MRESAGGEDASSPFGLYVKVAVLLKNILASFAEMVLQRGCVYRKKEAMVKILLPTVGQQESLVI
jgi:hypothetical protein